MQIIQIATEDKNGGAVRVPLYLHREYERKRVKSIMLVGEKYTSERWVMKIPNDEKRSRLAKKMREIEELLSPYLIFKGGWRIKEVIRFFGGPTRQMKIWLGLEDYDFPGTWWIPKFIDELKKKENEHIIINCHILHGFWLPDHGYFDLRVLPKLTKKAPVVLTLHDMWLMTGHCSHSLGCEKWKSGCVRCPDITLPPAIRHDLSFLNWLRKKMIYRKSAFWCIAPSQWIKKIAENSILAEGMIDIKVIPNGIDLKVFRTQDRKKARRKLGIPERSFIITTSGKSLKTNRWKGFDVFLSALEKICGMSNKKRNIKQHSSSAPEKIVAIALGGAGWGERKEVRKIGVVELHLLPFEDDHRKIAEFLSASDIFVLPSRAENFPMSLLEAMACGSVPIASRVGGMPEIIEDGKNGFLFKPEDGKELSEKILLLLENRRMLLKMRKKAVEKAQKFSISEQAGKYLEFFEQVAEEWDKK